MTDMRLHFLQPAAEALHSVITSNRFERILLVTGNKSFEISPLKPFCENLAKDKEVYHFSSFTPNPDTVELESGLESIGNFAFDCILAIGGGSVMDYAKLIKFFSGREWDMDSESFLKGDVTSAASLICVPTTAGSGSEATHFAVLYRDGKKYSVSSSKLLPEYVVLDPTLTYSMNPYLTACSGVDALCQAVESLWAKGATIESREYARISLFYILPHLRKAVLEPSMIDRRAMSIGSFYAGKAINISKTTGPHSLAYFLSSGLGLPHGEAVAVNLVKFFKLNHKHIPGDILNQMIALTGNNNTEGLISWLRTTIKMIGLRSSLSGISGLKLDEYLESINVERLSNDPIGSDISRVKSLLSSEIN